MSLSEDERPRAPSFARCVVAVAVDGVLKGLTVQAGADDRLSSAVRDRDDDALGLVDARQRVTISG